MIFEFCLCVFLHDIWTTEVKKKKEKTLKLTVSVFSRFDIVFKDYSEKI